jgi:hypothetical protein
MNYCPNTHICFQEIKETAVKPNFMSSNKNKLTNPSILHEKITVCKLNLDTVWTIHSLSKLWLRVNCTFIVW